MRRLTLGLLIGSLMLGGMVVPAEARGWHRRRHGHHYRHHVRHHDHHSHHNGHGYFLGGFLAGAGTVLILDALVTPRVAYAPPVVYQPSYYRGPVCRNIWVPRRWDLRSRQENGFTTYYHVWVEGYWQRQCY